MSYPKELFASFRSVLAEGLATVGYTLYNDDGTTKAARSTSDVACIGDSSTYHATVILDDDWTGYVLWDTGTADPLTAVEPVSDPRTQTKQAVDASQTGQDLADGGRLDLLVDAIAGDVAGLGGGSIPAVPTAEQIAAAVLDEPKGTHAGLLAGVALDETVAKDATALSNATWTGEKAGYLDASISSRSTFAGGAVESVTNGVSLAANQHVIVDSGTVSVSDKTGFALASAYDAAKTAASQSSVNDLGLPMQAGTAVVLAASQPNYEPATAAALAEVATAIGEIETGSGSTNASEFTGVFPAGVLANAPTGATASYTVSSTTVGEAPQVDITQYRYSAFGPVSIAAETAQNGDDHAFLVYAPGKPGTVLWSLTSDGGEISVGDDATTITLTDTDAYMSTPGRFQYVLRNTTADTVVCTGWLTIVDCPNVPSE